MALEFSHEKANENLFINHKDKNFNLKNNCFKTRNKQSVIIFSIHIKDINPKIERIFVFKTKRKVITNKQKKMSEKYTRNFLKTQKE